MNAPRQSPDEAHPLELVAAAALASVLVAAASTALVGGLAGALFGGGWVATRLPDAIEVLGRISHHLDDPRQAWPARSRAELPGAIGFYAAAVLVLAGIAGATMLALRLRRGGAPAGSGDGAARWATPRDLAPLRIRRRVHGRIALGRQARRLVAAEAGQSVIVVAPTQTGKTTGLAVPALLEWDAPAVATSVKNDLLHDTFARRAALGEVKVFDPAATTGLPRARWTPLAGCTDWQGARRTAHRLAQAAQPSGRSLQDADFWAHAGARFLAPLLYAAASTARTMADVLRWIDTEEQAEIMDALASPHAEPARHALMIVWTADDRLRSSLYLTASLALQAYGDPTVCECSDRSELTPSWLLEKANTLYLCAPADEQSRLRPLFVTLLREIVGDVYARAARTGRPINPPLLLALDEAPNIAPLPDLDQIASTGAGQGLQLITVVQDLAQIEARWGTRAHTIVNNHRAKLFGPGLSCAKTLDYVSRVLGDAAVRQTSSTSGDRGRRSTTETTTYRTLVPPNVAREAAPGSMLLVYGHLRPAWIELRPWFRDRGLRKHAAAERADTAT